MLVRHADLREAAASIGPVARVVVDSQRFLVDVDERATELFSIGPADQSGVGGSSVVDRVRLKLPAFTVPMSPGGLAPAGERCDRRQPGARDPRQLQLAPCHLPRLGQGQRLEFPLAVRAAPASADLATFAGDEAAAPARHQGSHLSLTSCSIAPANGAQLPGPSRRETVEVSGMEGSRGRLPGSRARLDLRQGYPGSSRWKPVPAGSRRR
jgi:hypothetical protein